MKKISLIATLLFTTTSTLAATGQGYREYGETMKSTPGFNAGIQELPAGSFEKMFGKYYGDKKDNIRHSMVKSNTQVPPRSGKARDYIRVDGYHQASITNNTTARQQYHLNFELSCGAMSSSFSRYIDQVTDIFIV